ncbi:hypothetical protein ACFY7C_06730 [Streptomyces sp. NPDC012769]|uniref:hypothetical protein n=1 Tax=Streptomyces sp. NPDC012769 TaxID=3364848 RepID=UPI0036C0613F
MGAARQRLWECLRGLREAAESARRAQGRPDSQAAVVRELKASGFSGLSGLSGLSGFSGQRISDWAPEKPSALSIPQARSDDQVVALAALWADWAGETVSTRHLRNLLEKARDEQRRERQEAAGGPASAGQADHATVADHTPWQLEVTVAPPPGPDAPPFPSAAGPASLTPYLIRAHDHALRSCLATAVSGGAAGSAPSVLAVLTGDSSTGKTRAMYEAVRAVAPDRRLLRPPSARALLDLLAGNEVEEGCVLWLNELQRILLDREGDAAAVELTTALRQRPGVVAVAGLWEDPYWRDFTAQGVPGDPARHTRALLTGAHARRFRVPGRLTPDDLARWEELARAGDDARMAAAGRAGTVDGRVVQHLSGGPELLDAHLSGPGGHFTPREHALVTAALDARRLGHQEPLPEQLLAEAADGALAPYDRASRADWAAPELAALTAGSRADGSRADIRRTLTPLRALRASAGAPPRYEPSDYLLQHAARPDGDREGPASLWDALVLHTRGTEDLHRLQSAAWRRGLFRHALSLDRRAALMGNGDACVRIVERTARHPDAARAADWAVVHMDLSDDDAVARLIAALRASGAPEAVDALARRLAARVDPRDVRAVAAFVDLLAEQGVSDGVAASLTESLMESLADSLADVLAGTHPLVLGSALSRLATRAPRGAFRATARYVAAHADLTDAYRAAPLMAALAAADVPDATATLVARVLAGAPDQDPDELPVLMERLWRDGVEQAVRALIALDPAARVGLGHADVVLSLLRVLRQAGDDEGVRTLLGRSPARHVDVVGDPDFYELEFLLCELLTEFHTMRADAEFGILADRLAAGMRNDSPSAVATLLDLFHSTGRTENARLLLARTPMAEVDYDDPAELTPLLRTLLRTGASAEYDALAACVVSDVDITDPDFVGEVVDVLWETGGQRGIAPLLERARAHRPPENAVFVVDHLSDAGARDAATGLAGHIARHVAGADSDPPDSDPPDPDSPDLPFPDRDFPDLDLTDYLLWSFQAAGASEALVLLLDRGLVDRLDPADGYADWHALTSLLGTLCTAGPKAAAHARAFADRAAAGIDLAHTYGIAELLGIMTEHGLSAPRAALIRRAAAGASLTSRIGVARLIEAFLAAGAGEAVEQLLRRDPLARIDRGGAADADDEPLLTALRKAGSPQAETFARWARAAGRLPVEPYLPYGVDPGGRPAAPWSWPADEEA